MTFTPDTARTWVDVDLDAIRANARRLASLTGSRLLPMVKANGYGLGAIAVVAALESLEPWGYGVATVEEGAALRAAAIRRPILVVSPLVSELIEPYLTHDLRPAIGDPRALEAWLARSDRPFHLEIDTGMGRAGVRWDDGPALERIGRQLHGASAWEGAFTHFHSADTNPSSAAEQWQRFQTVLGTLPRRPPLVHAANSAAALRGKIYAADLIRPGIFLYGGAAGGEAPKQVATLRTRVVAVRRVAAGESVSYGATWRASRPTTVATLAMGYADGFLRSAGEHGGRPARVVELAGGLVPVIGRVTMDLTMVELADRTASVGDVATVYGADLPLDRQAEAAGTIAYELLTALGGRVPRRYLTDDPI